jgi:hypothetical protein
VSALEILAAAGIIIIAWVCASALRDSETKEDKP